MDEKTVRFFTTSYNEDENMRGEQTMIDKVAVLIVEQHSVQGIQNAINTKIDELKTNKFYVKDVRIDVFHKGLLVSILYSFRQAKKIDI